jgi:lycopene beta-cyclase
MIRFLAATKNDKWWLSGLEQTQKTANSETNHWPLIIVGAGLASSITVQRLAQLDQPPEILLLESTAEPFGKHTWSFHLTDISDADLKWIAPLVAHQWTGQSVRFQQYRRELSSGYASLTSASVANAMSNIKTLTLRTNTSVETINSDHVVLANGTILTADCVIDARGFETNKSFVLGHQKFVGLEIETEAPHGLINPIIMDASVDQRDGYRFIYVLPFSSTRLLIEDTRYSDGDDLDLQALTKDIAAYAEAQNWSISRVVGQEHGILPIALAQDFAGFWKQRPSDIPQIGMRAGLFHPTTGYSLPEAVKVANLVADLWPTGSAVLADRICKHAWTRWRQQGFYRFLNRMLFRAAIPNKRHLVLQRFYTLPQPLIERFYASRTPLLDKLRILIGKPPVPVLRALSCLRERPLLKEKNK